MREITDTFTDSAKNHGQWLHSDCAGSVSETVSKSRERVRKNCRELRSIVIEISTKSRNLLAIESAMPADSDPRLHLNRL
jgi:hypothetical protein